MIAALESSSAALKWSPLVWPRVLLFGDSITQVTAARPRVQSAGPSSASPRPLGLRPRPRTASLVSWPIPGSRFPRLSRGCGEESTDVIPGLDGRKMSKSYDNIIDIFLESKALKKKLGKIVTNSQGIEEPKDPDSCNVFKLYKLFATPEQTDALAARYRAGGMGWGHAKAELQNVLEEQLGPAREKYFHLLNHTEEIDKILAYGKEKARIRSKEMMDIVRETLGTF